MTGLDCSILIATRNRREELRRTLSILMELDPPAREILVGLDGCTDGSEEVVKAFHPQVCGISLKGAGGSIPARNRLAGEACGEWLLFLDDDSHPEDRSFMAGLVETVQRYPRAAVVTFPQRSDEFPETLGQGDFGPAMRVGTYTSSGAVIRRGVFMQLGGYPDVFSHAYEEPDFSLRCVAAGYSVVMDPALVIRHRYTATRRNEIGTHHLHARNEQWSIWMRCPWPWWPLISLRRAAGQFYYACKRGPGWVTREPVWWVGALAGFGQAWGMRKPVAWMAYRKWMRLLKRPESVGAVRKGGG